MRREWDEVQRAVRDGSLYRAEISTLRRYLEIVTDPPPSENPAFHATLQQVSDTIRYLILQKENETQIAKSLMWARIAAVAAILGALLVLVQLLIS